MPGVREALDLAAALLSNRHCRQFCPLLVDPARTDRFNADDITCVIVCRDGVVHCAPVGRRAFLRAQAGEVVIQA